MNSATTPTTSSTIRPTSNPVRPRYSAFIDESFNLDHLVRLKKLGVEHLLVPLEGLSREKGMSKAKAQELCLRLCAKDAGLSVTLLADRLVEQVEWGKFKKNLEPWMDYTLRVRDMGVALWLGRELKKDFELSLESGNANAQAVLGWEKSFGDKIKRLVLNPEMERDFLLPLLKQISAPTEILGLGAPLLYYSPRPQLSWTTPEQKESFISHEDVGHLPLKIVESTSGTALYYSRELCLLPYEQDLAEAGLTWLRLDFRSRTEQEWQALEKAAQEGTWSKLKHNWPRPLLHGFYGKNRSDAQFVNLGGGNRRELKGIKLAEVLDQDEELQLIRALETLSVGTELAFCTDKGEYKQKSIQKLFSVHGELLDASVALRAGEMGLVPRLRGISRGRGLYRPED